MTSAAEPGQPSPVGATPNLLLSFASRQMPAITALADRHGLDTFQAGQLAALLDLVCGDEHAPTTVNGPSEVLDVHLADSLVALDLPQVRSALRAVDLGSGAGFPGLVLAVALPNCSVSVAESQSRKCAFLERAIEAAAIVNATVVCRRVEEWSEGLAVHDLVTARALAAPAVVVEYAAPLLSIGGWLVDWRGRRAGDEETAARHAAAIVGLEAVEIVPVQPFADAHSRHLHLYVKVRDTPDRFPRRAGMATKKPLARRDDAAISGSTCD